LALEGRAETWWFTGDRMRRDECKQSVRLETPVPLRFPRHMKRRWIDYSSSPLRPQHLPSEGRSLYSPCRGGHLSQPHLPPIGWMKSAYGVTFGAPIQPDGVPKLQLFFLVLSIFTPSSILGISSFSVASRALLQMALLICSAFSLVPAVLSGNRGATA